MMDMYYYREEAKVEMNFQDITMDGSKVYRMAAKGQEKRRGLQKRRTTESGKQKMERTGNHEG